MQRWLGHTDDREQRAILTRARPGQRTSLRIGVDDQDAQSSCYGIVAREIEAERGLTHTTFLIQKADDHQVRKHRNH